MIAWVFAVPIFLMLMVLTLDKLESSIVAPIDRAVKIVRLVNEAPAEQVEREVAALLAPALSAPPRRDRAAAPPAAVN
ncbi:MAG: hypothetical protein ABR548_14135 [Actinomycetota bacterium]|nr:hypothetical protein [Actinomycetota bacterium]